MILEYLARMTLFTLGVQMEAEELPAFHRDKHFFRKHGATATYGQK